MQLLGCRQRWVAGVYGGAGGGIMLHTHALNRGVGSAYREEKDGERLLVSPQSTPRAISFSGRRLVYLISGLLKRWNNANRWPPLFQGIPRHDCKTPFSLSQPLILGASTPGSAGDAVLDKGGVFPFGLASFGPTWRQESHSDAERTNRVQVVRKSWSGPDSIPTLEWFVLQWEHHRNKEPWYVLPGNRKEGKPCRGCACWPASHECSMNTLPPKGKYANWLGTNHPTVQAWKHP